MGPFFMAVDREHDNHHRIINASFTYVITAADVVQRHS